MAYLWGETDNPKDPGPPIVRGIMCKRGEGCKPFSRPGAADLEADLEKVLQRDMDAAIKKKEAELPSTTTLLQREEEKLFKELDAFEAGFSENEVVVKEAFPKTEKNCSTYPAVVPDHTTH